MTRPTAENFVDERSFDVTFFQRLPRLYGNFSLEFIFQDVRERLKEKIRSRVVYAPKESSGTLNRMIVFQNAWKNAGLINHVTGDINYVTMALPRKSTVLTVLDCGFLNRKPGITRALLKLLWLDWPVRHARIVTTISSHARSEIIGYTRCNPMKVRVVPVAISDQFRLFPKVFDKQLPRILQIGTAPNKNVPNLIRAISGIPCQLVIIGLLDQNTRRLLEQEKIDYLNQTNLSAEQIREQYRLCDIVSFVSTFEGFGMPILEGNKVGRAVITSNCASMPEVAGEAAALTDPTSVESIRSAIRRIIADDDYRNRLIELGTMNTQRFDGMEIADKYFDIYAELSEQPQQKTKNI